MNRVGEKNRAKNGLMMEIIAYRSACDIDVEFEDGEKVYNRRYEPFKKGCIKHPTIKTKIKKAKIFDANPFGLYSILIFESLSYENKHKKINDKWIEIDEKEPVLNVYEVLRGDE